jgi:outer membrane lipoprotein-sorting protein
MREFSRPAVSRRLALMFGAVAVMATAVAAPDPRAVLSASDAIRNPAQPFRVTVTMTEFEKGQQVNTSTLVSFARTLEKGGQFASVLRFMQPPRDAGKVLLKNGADLWFYDPGTKSAVRISPQQRLMGQASNGDVVTVNFERDYKAAIEAEETITDGERKQRRSRRLKLTAANDDATYASIDLWVDADTSAPLKARFYADSGRLLKTAYYRKYQQQLGAERPTETVIVDGLDPQSITVVRLTDYSPRNIPAQWFQRDHLPRFNAE